VSSPEVADHDEILKLLTKAARMGDVSAMRILLTELPHRSEKASEEANFIDELASKRKKAVIRVG
jgi:hypothetical protein